MKAPQREIERAVKVLAEGGLVGLPTETVYGLAADAQNELAVRRIFAVKGRPATHPLIVHVASSDAARKWVSHFPPSAELLAQAFWPGPLTLVLPRSRKASDAVTGGQDTVALRVPKHEVALQVLEAFRGGLAAPSANRFGKLSPTRAAHVRDDLGAQVDLVLDGGPCVVGVESTIVDLTGTAPRLLRPGGLSLESLERVLGAKVALDSTGAPRVPGSLEAHYAPRAGLRIVASGQVDSEASALRATGQKVATLRRGTAGPGDGGSFDIGLSDEDAARALFATLRDIDSRGFDVIVCEQPDASGLGLALRDRLSRAAVR